MCKLLKLQALYKKEGISETLDNVTPLAGIKI